MNDQAPDDLQKRRQLAKKALKKKIATLDDTIRESLAQTNYAKNKQEQLKTKKMVALSVGIIIVLGFIIGSIFMPKKGTMTYGLCKVFIELHVEYPDEMRFTYVNRFPDRVRVWYVKHDSFGQKQMDKADCFFDRDPNGQLYMKKVEINRGEIDPREIDLFNASIPTIMAYPPDLTYPKGFPDDIKRFRKSVQK